MATFTDLQARSRSIGATVALSVNETKTTREFVMDSVNHMQQFATAKKGCFHRLEAEKMDSRWDRWHSMCYSWSALRYMTTDGTVLYGHDPPMA